MQVVFPELSRFAQERVHSLGVGPVVGVVEAQEHVHRGEGGVALLAQEHPASLAGNAMAVGHERGLQTAWPHADIVIDPAHFQEFLGIGPGGGQVVEDGGIVGFGQFRMVGGEDSPPRCLMVVVEVVIGLPGGTVGGRPVAEERRRELRIPAARGHQVQRAVVVPLQQWVADVDERFRPEVPPPLAMGRAEGFQAFRGEGGDPSLGLIQRLGGFLIGDNGGDQDDGLSGRQHEPIG